MMRRNFFLRGVSAASLLLLAFEASAQQSLPTIEVGARSRGTARRTGGAHSAAGGSSGQMTSTSTAAASDYRSIADGPEPIPEGSYVAPSSTTGTKIPTRFMDTPLNVQVVTPQQLQDRQVTTVADAVRFVSGVNVQPGINYVTGDPRIAIRGLPVLSILRNGFRSELFYNGDMQSLANVESVEVLKGPAAILYGMVEPGGMLNIVTKQPKEAPAYNVQQQIGSFNFYRTVAGATGPVTPDKSILYRVDMSYENAGSFIKKVHTDNLFIAPVVRWNISPDTQVTTELQYTYAHDGSAVPVVPTFDGVPIPMQRSRNYGEYSPVKNEELLFGLNWSHKFNENWSFKHQVQYTRRALDYPNSVGLFDAYEYDVGSIVVPRWTTYGSFAMEQFATQANLNGRFNTGELEHNFLIGGDYYRYMQAYRSGINFWDIGSVDAFTQLPVLPPDFSNFERTGQTVQDNYHAGVYVQDQIKLPFNIHLLGGVRYQNFRQFFKRENPNTRLFSQRPAKLDARVTPRVAALWRPQEWLSFYGNYAEGFGANEGRSYPDDPVSPSDARQWEFGSKLEFFGGKLRATFAYFNLTKTNVPTDDLRYPNQGFVTVSGAVNSKGPEVDIQGEILPGWNLSLAYANLETRIVQSNNNNSAGRNEVGDRFPFLPRNTASFFSTYELQDGDWRGFKFGGGVTYQDSRPMQNFTTISQPWPSVPAYATAELMASYAFDMGGAKWTAQVNAYNLLDHRYYAQGLRFSEPGGGWWSDWLVPGAPRTIMGSLSAKF